MQRCRSVPLSGLVLTLLLLSVLQVKLRAAQVGEARGASQPASQPAAPSPASDRSVLERRLQVMLTDVQLRGTWQVTSVGPAENRDQPRAMPAELTEPRPDTYSILEAHKAEGDWWLLRVRIQYEAVDAVVPIRLRVLYAGDTPVLTVDNFTMPGGNTYSARVMIHGGFYAGTWTGPGCGGVLSGQIVRAPRPAADEGE